MYRLPALGALTTHAFHLPTRWMAGEKTCGADENKKKGVLSVVKRFLASQASPSPSSGAQPRVACAPRPSLQRRRVFLLEYIVRVWASGACSLRHLSAAATRE